MQERELKKKFYCYPNFRRLAVVCLLFCLFISSTQAQEKNDQLKLSITGYNITLAQAFQQIKKETGLTVFYTSQLLSDSEKVTVNFKNARLVDVLNYLLKDKGIDYEFRRDKVIVLRKKNVPQTNLPSKGSVRSLTGKVTDEKGESLPGVSISIKGAGIASVTDVNGAYKLVATSEDDILVFSYLGFSTEEITIGKQRTINVVLKVKVSALDQVVVIGYGEVKKSDLTGSVSEVKMTDLKKAPVATFEQALAGRVAGVQISSGDGQPGSDLNVVIRGGNSLTQENAPLYVVDGFPLEGSVGSIVSPSDIESISILKDASATAIYGARGANGVVIIETKKGKIGKPDLQYEGSYGLNNVTKKLDLLNPNRVPIPRLAI